MDEIQLTQEQMRILLNENRATDDNPEEWETGSTSGGSSSLSGSSASTPPPRAKSPVYVIPAKQTKDTSPAYENSSGNPEDKTGKPVGARPGQPGATFRVQSVPYVLRDAQFRYLKQRFPRTLFRATDDQNHDHPIAHTETLVASRHMQQKYPKDIKILDMYGSPNANEYYNERQLTAAKPTGRSMETLVKCFTEKDYIRKGTKWGKRTVTDAEGTVKERYVERDILDVGDDNNFSLWAAGFDHYQFVHTLYYMRLELLAALLCSGEDGQYKTFSAVIHKHSLPEGKMFGGEVTYKKNFGVVRQVNRETGESYVHQDLSFLFESETKVWRDAKHAFTWTFHKVTDETWIIWGSGCPNNMDERFVSYSKDTGPNQAAHRMNQEALLSRPEWACEKYTLPGCKSRMVGGKLVIQPGIVDLELTVSNYEFIDYLRYQVAGKPRDHDQYASLMAIGRREVEAGSRFPGSHSFEVPVDEFQYHVTVAFFMDAQKEIGTLQCLQAMGSILRTHRALSSGDAMFNFNDQSSTVRSAVSAARLVHSVVRSKDTFDGILGAFEKTTYK